MAGKNSGRSGGLGRGLGSLLANTAVPAGAAPGTASAPDNSLDTSSEALTAAGRYAELPVSAIKPNPRQPRAVFEPEALAELVHSIKEIGLLQPVVVRPLGGNSFELIAGERRLRATMAAGLTSIPAIIRETADADLLRDALLENLHRANLNVLEEAAAYQQLLEDFGCTQEELATRIGRSRPQVSNTLRLLKLPPSVQKRVAVGVISAGHAKALAGVADSALVEQLAARVVAQGLSVRALEELIAVGAPKLGRTGKKSTSKGKNLTAFPEVATRLEHVLETRVTIEAPKGQQPGAITLHFADTEDLGRLVDVLLRVP